MPNPWAAGIGDATSSYSLTSPAEGIGLGIGSVGVWAGSYPHMDNAAANTEDELTLLLRSEYAQLKRAGVGKRPMSSRVFPVRRQADRALGADAAASVDAADTPRDGWFPPAAVPAGHPAQAVRGRRRPQTSRTPHRAAHEHPGCVQVPQPPPRHRPGTGSGGPAVTQGRPPPGAPPARAAAAPPPPPLTGSSRIPHETFVLVFQFLDFRGLCCVSLVCRAWSLSSSADWLWRRISAAHKSRCAPVGTQTWKAAFSTHVLGMRNDLDTEMAGLLDIVRRSDKRLEQSKQALVHSNMEGAVQDIASRQAAVSSSSSSSSSSVSASAAAALPPTHDLASIKEKTVQLEAVVNKIQLQVGDAERKQRSLESLRTRQEEANIGLSGTLQKLKNDVKAMTVLEARSLFLRRFQKHVIGACFDGAGRATAADGAVPVALRRGTDSFSQMQILVATLGASTDPCPSWAAFFHAFTAYFPLDDVWWEVQGVLARAPSDEELKQPSAHDLLVPYGKDSPQQALLRTMTRLLSMSPAELATLLTPYIGKQF